MLRAVLTRYTLSAASDNPEPTGRRSITLTPSRRATVVLHDREPALAPRPAPLETLG